MVNLLGDLFTRDSNKRSCGIHFFKVLVQIHYSQGIFHSLDGGLFSILLMDFFNFTTKVSIRFGTNSRQVDLVPEHVFICNISNYFLNYQLEPLGFSGIQISKKKGSRPLL